MGKDKTADEIIKKIESLRRRGYSLPEISKKLSIAKTTAFRYTRDIEILPKYGEILKIKRGGSRKRKRLKEQKALAQARRFANLSDREKLLFISALYWGEGTKKDFSLSNTDPHLIKVFVTVLKQVLKINSEDLRVSVRIYEDLDKEQCLSFWSEVIGVPKEQFVNVNILTGKKKGKLLYGMCRVRIRKGGDTLKRIVAINKVVASSMSP